LKRGGQGRFNEVVLSGGQEPAVGAPEQQGAHRGRNRESGKRMGSIKEKRKEVK